jgi:hypothetical protein
VEAAMRYEIGSPEFKSRKARAVLAISVAKPSQWQRNPELLGQLIAFQLLFAEGFFDETDLIVNINKAVSSCAYAYEFDRFIT